MASAFFDERADKAKVLEFHGRPELAWTAEALITCRRGCLPQNADSQGQSRLVVYMQTSDQRLVSAASTR